MVSKKQDAKKTVNSKPSLVDPGLTGNGAFKVKTTGVVKPSTQNRARATNIHHVAERAGVSIKTVSRVINQEPAVREETVQRVQKAILDLNYRPNFSARNLAGRRAYLIALLYDNPSDHYLVALQEGALIACQQLGYGLLLQPLRYDSPRLIDDIHALVRERRPAGLVITPPICDVAGVLDALADLEVDVALISPLNLGPLSLNRPIVTVDDQRASYDLTSYLLALGHRRIGFIKGHPAHGAASRRYQGFLDALRDQNIQDDPALIVQGLFSFDSGREAGRVLLSLGNRPTAIFACNDDMAAGVLYVAQEMGMRVPQDLSLAGFDDAPLSRNVWPSLTTVCQPIRAMAESVVRTLIGVSRHHAGGGSAGPNVTTMPHELMIRASTALLPGKKR